MHLVNFLIIVFGEPKTHNSLGLVFVGVPPYHLVVVCVMDHPNTICVFGGPDEKDLLPVTIHFTKQSKKRGPNKAEANTAALQREEGVKMPPKRKAATKSHTC